MRRIVTALAAVVAVTLAGLAAGAREQSDMYRVDAIFDNAAFLAEGQDLKVAGVPAGKVTGFKVTADRKARIEMVVDKRFAPFRGDASCNIQPQSLIGERFVQCTPGTPRAPALRGQGDRPPTIPVARTSAPVDLDIVLSPLRLPVRQRLALLLSGLGQGLAGRPADLNAALRRANPALGETRRVLGILERDRTRLAAIVGESDRILAALERRKRRVGDFVEQGDRFTSVTAERRVELAETVRRLPPLLREAQPSLAAVSRLAQDGTPLAADLRRAAGPTDRLVRQLSPFVDQARPALRRLGRTANVGTPALRAAAPQVKRLRRFAVDARPAGRLVRELFVDMRRRGVVEGLLRFLYVGALTSARFDDTSHIAGAYIIPVSQCALVTPVPLPGCDAHFKSYRAPGQGATAGRSGSAGSRAPAPAPRRADDRGRRTPPPGTRPSPPAAPAPPASAPAPSGGPVPPSPPTQSEPGGGIPLLDYLFK